MSMNPGATTSPRASITRRALASGNGASTRSIRSPRIATSPTKAGVAGAVDDSSALDQQVNRLLGLRPDRWSRLTEKVIAAHTSHSDRFLNIFDRPRDLAAILLER